MTWWPCSPEKGTTVTSNNEHHTPSKLTITDEGVAYNGTRLTAKHAPIEVTTVINEDDIDVYYYEVKLTLLTECLEDPFWVTKEDFELYSDGGLLTTPIKITRTAIVYGGIDLSTTGGDPDLKLLNRGDRDTPPTYSVTDTFKVDELEVHLKGPKHFPHLVFNGVVYRKMESDRSDL